MKNRLKLARQIRQIGGDETGETCALCGQVVKTYRWVSKRSGRLQAGYYRPQLTADELHRLQEGQSPICVPRRACAERQLAARHKALAREIADEVLAK